MKDAQPKAIRLADYRVPDFLIDSTELHFDLHDEVSTVTAMLSLRRNPAAERNDAPLVLNGQGLVLKRLAIYGAELDGQRYAYDGELLTIASVPDAFTLASVVEIRPQDNTALEGLYRSRTMYCTQCEAEGFRRITFFLDRPDALSLFTTTIEADRARYPVLLSNGNEIARGEAADGRHWVRWQDPWPKPCYLFALVAGDLACVEDSFRTCSGRDVTLRLFVESKDLDKCDFAIQALKDAMRWDEEVYGREYDLDIFMIVAVDDFNMGAMENKGLNIFNTSCVLANPAITTDASFQNIAAIVAHEYFHNWSGNRVTCRDWFQLSLKEGFTVFRDQEFSADTGSRAVTRIEDVALLRTGQFVEDGGPLAHPVRPDAYIEINNFYTRTVYEKGAEVVRMIRELLGAEAFRRGTDLYFARHDGQAVTTEDFVRAMEEASGRDLAQFRLWYTQAGTPTLTVTDEYDAGKALYRLTIAQQCPPTPSQPHKLPMHIPVRVGLVGAAGDMSLDADGRRECVLELTQAEQSFEFTGIAERPVPSLLRGFSAPVKLKYDYGTAQLSRLMQQDSDGFARWDAGQSLAIHVLQTGNDADQLVDAFRRLLLDENADGAMIARTLTLPSEAYLAELAEVIDPGAIHATREGLRRRIASELRAELLACHARNRLALPYEPSAAQIAARALNNVCLAYLALLDDGSGLELAATQYAAQDNMTDVLAALGAVVHYDISTGRARAAELLADFHARWHHEALVLNLWFSTQALRPGADTLADVVRLRAHPDFDARNPNKLRALIGAYSASNPSGFHRADLAGYRFLREQVAALDASNPMIAARLLQPFTRWRNFAAPYGEGMRAALAELAALPNLSRDCYEVVSKSLA